MKLGDMVKNYRMERGYSMEDFGKLCGLSRAYISLLESNRNPTTGKPISPSVNTLDKIASVMGMTFNELVASLDEDTIITSHNSLEDAADDLDKKYDKLLPRYARRYTDNQDKTTQSVDKNIDTSSKLAPTEKEELIRLLAKLEVQQLQRVRNYINMLIDLKQ